MKKLIYLLLVIQITKEQCLDKDVLENYGFKVLDVPQVIENPGVCTKILSEANVKTCVDLDQYKEFIDGLIKNENLLAEAELTETLQLINDSEAMLENYQDENNLEIDLMDPAIEAELEIMREIKGTEDQDLDIKDAEKDCRKNQNTVDIGVFCLMISDQIKTDFITDVKFYDGIAGNSGTVTVGENVYDRVYSDPITIKVKENSADQVVKACGKKAKGACFAKRMMELEASKETGIKMEKDEACNMIQCAEEGNCNSLEKATIFQNKPGKLHKEDRELMKGLKEKDDETKALMKEKFGARKDEIKKLFEQKKELLVKIKADSTNETLKAELKTLDAKIKELKEPLDKEIRAFMDELKQKNKEKFGVIIDKRNNKEKKEKKEKASKDDSEIGKMNEEFKNQKSKEHEEIKILITEKINKIKEINNSELTEEEKKTKIDAIVKEINEKIKAIKDASEKKVEGENKNYEDKQKKREEEGKLKDEERKKKKKNAEGEKPKPPQDGETPPPKLIKSGVTTTTSTSNTKFNFVVDQAGYDAYVEGTQANIETGSFSLYTLSLLTYLITIF